MLKAGGFRNLLEFHNQLNNLVLFIYFSLLYSATAGDLTALKRFHFSGVNMSNANYDGRTALHLAAAEGHASCVKFLVESCKLNPLAKDRFVHDTSSIQKAPTYLLLPLAKWGSKCGDFHWAMGCA